VQLSRANNFFVVKFLKVVKLVKLWYPRLMVMALISNFELIQAFIVN
jgi:hypothetical protein